MHLSIATRSQSVSDLQLYTPHFSGLVAFRGKDGKKGSRSSEKEGTEGPTPRRCQECSASSIKRGLQTIQEEGQGEKGGNGEKEENERRTKFPGDQGTKNRRVQDNVRQREEGTGRKTVRKRASESEERGCCRTVGWFLGFPLLRFYQVSATTLSNEEACEVGRGPSLCKRSSGHHTATGRGGAG